MYWKENRQESFSWKLGLYKTKESQECRRRILRENGKEPEGTHLKLPKGSPFPPSPGPFSFLDDSCLASRALGCDECQANHSGIRPTQPYSHSP